jgi:pilus assembly protein TadC
LALLLGWPWGPLAGVLGALGVYLGLGRLEPGALQARRGREVGDLPLACDLLAGCLASGATLPAAAAASAAALGGPLADRLGEVSARLRLGAPPPEAWAAFARAPGRGPAAREHRRALGDVSRAVSAAAESGAPLSDVLAGLAEDARARALLAARLRARAVGVRAVLPLGLCFLPAFVLLGVVPLVAGMAGQVFG